MNRIFIAVTCAWMSSAPTASLAQFIEVPTPTAAEFAAEIQHAFDKWNDPTIAIDADIDKANGVYIPDELGALIVPQKGLAETEEQDEKFATANGGAIGYLVTHNILPLVDDEPVDEDQVHSVFDEFFIFALVVKRQAADDYRLLVYGKGGKALIEAPFSLGDGPGPEPVSVHISDVNEAERTGSLVVTVFGAYQAKVRGLAVGP